MQSPIIKEKGLIGMLLQIRTPRGIQSKNSSCIGVSGNYPASSEHPPRKFQDHLGYIQKLVFCPVLHLQSRLVSCLCVSSHASSRLSSCDSKSSESVKIVDKSDAMMTKIGMKMNCRNRAQSLPGKSPGHPKLT